MILTISSISFQDWLTLDATLISTVCNKPVEWVTPLGLPVCQSYYRHCNIETYNEAGVKSKTAVMYVGAGRVNDGGQVAKMTIYI